MAIAAATVWEIRPATGSDTNGGGFVPGSSGTDFSQQASPQYSVTDGVTAGSTTIISATANFGTDVVGNLIYVAGGTASLAGVWRQIVSRTNATTIVVDAATGLGVSTGVTLHIGGALASLSQISTNFVDGNIAYAVGTFTLTSTVTWAASYNNAVQLIGYTTTRGDGGKITVTSSTNSVDLFTLHAQFIKFQNINFTHTAGTRGNAIIDQAVANSFNITLQNCTVDGCQRGVFADWIQACLLVNCEIKNCIGDGYQNVAGTFIACYIHGNGGVGISSPADNSANAPGPLFVLRCICSGNTSHGVFTNTQSPTTGQLNLIIVNSAFVSNGGSGFALRNSEYTVHLENNIFYGNTAFGILYSGASSILSLGPVTGGANAFGANGSGDRSTFPTLPGDVSLSADPFTNKAAGDFSLNSTAGGGAACRQAGFPGVLNAGGTGFANIGVLDPSTGGGGSVFAVECNTSIIISRGGVAGY